jgi:hypothetical protein
MVNHKTGRVANRRRSDVGMTASTFARPDDNKRCPLCGLKARKMRMEGGEKKDKK